MPKQAALVIAAILLAAIAGAATVKWRDAQRQVRQCVVDDTLQTVGNLLEENKQLIGQLYADGPADSDAAILVSYLARIRKDGVTKNAGMKQRIDSLVNNNTAIIALLGRYEPHAQTATFKAAAQRYDEYASNFRDRWQSLIEIFMAGGNLPTSGPAFPVALEAAVSVEIAAGT